MAKLGFKAGQSLGKAPLDETHADKDKPQQTTHRSEPLNLIFKEDRGGIGLDNEKKRKIREEAEEATGIRPRALYSRLSKVIQTGFSLWPSRPMAGSWRLVPTIQLSGSGMRPRAHYSRLLRSRE